MPTKRTHRGHSQLPQVSRAVLALLGEGLFEMSEDAEHELSEWEFFTDEAQRLEIIERIKEPLLAEWIRQRPGTRPSWWWERFSPESRRRLGGIGDPAHEFLAYAESYRCGLPSIFVDPWLVEYFNGRACDVHGRRIGTEYAEGSFKGRAIDPRDPPLYESEATYLRRHGLLTASETRR